MRNILLLILLVSCNPVKQVLKDKSKFDQVAAEVIRQGYCATDTLIIVKSDTLVKVPAPGVFADVGRVVPAPVHTKVVAVEIKAVLTVYVSPLYVNVSLTAAVEPAVIVKVYNTGT